MKLYIKMWQVVIQFYPVQISNFLYLMAQQKLTHNDYNIFLKNQKYKFISKEYEDC